MKRTCLQVNTNTDEQNSCEFHPVEILLKEHHFDPKDNQFVKNFIRMKNFFAPIFFLIVSFSFPLNAQEPFRVLTHSFEKNKNFTSSELNKQTLKFYLKDKNPDSVTREVLSKLNHMKLMNFDISSSSQNTLFEQVKKTYILDNFTAFKVEVTNDNYQRIYLKQKGESISELLVINSINNHFSLIELQGVIDLDKIAALKSSMNIQGLDALTKLNTKPEKNSRLKVSVKDDAQSPIVYVNGYRSVESVKQLQQINPECISSVNVIKNGATDKGSKNGVIEIKLKEASNIFTVCEGTLYFGQNGELQCYRINDVSSPKLLLDCETKPLAEIENIEAKNIQSIEYTSNPQSCNKVQNGKFIVLKTK